MIVRITLLSIISVMSLSAQQIHPCDIPDTPTVQVRRSDVLKLGFCYPSVDDEGASIPLGLTQFILYNGPNQIWDMGLMQPVTGPNSNGLYYYEHDSTFSLAADNQFILVAIFGGISSLPSSPLFVDVRGGPKMPSGIRVIISGE